MQWGYPRTVEGFFHALSRGQYGTGEATNVFRDPARIMFQMWYLVKGLAESFSWVYLFIGLLPVMFLGKMHKRERAWILGIISIYFFLSVLLVLVLNVSPDRSTTELNKVFFTASHAMFAILIGYGITLLAAYIATNYEKMRSWGIVGGVIALVLAMYNLLDDTGTLFYGPGGEISLFQLPHHIMLAFDKDQYGLPVFSNLILVCIPIIFLAALFFYRQRGPVLLLLALLSITPFCSAMLHWYKCEQRNHWYGYWFGHDMFTPPYLGTDGKLTYDNVKRTELLKDPKNARLIYPEMDRNTILFGGTDPGRFCPTYAIFCDSFIPNRCKPEQDQKFDRRDCYLITQNALADGTYLDYLRSQYNRSKQIDPAFFSELSKYIFGIALHTTRLSAGTALDKGISKDAPEYRYYAEQESQACAKIASRGIYGFVNNCLSNVLDRPFLAWGSHVEKQRRAEGVYPPSEIYIPSPEDSQACFLEYARRKQINSAGGSIEISGQQDVMAINGLLCRVIFDQNPTNSFYVEESFPLDWMYPYETPFGIIMKINRNVLPELTQDIFDLDHKFWSDYSTRLCGNWINYDTSISTICDFVERTYIHNNYKGYIGARSFVRDDDAQKAFSKLRSSQAGVYAWRADTRTCPPEYRQKTPESQQALIRETDFAFKQAFAFCPYSPEAVYRYINFLLPLGRFDDAILVAETCQKLDPENGEIVKLVNSLKQFKQDNTQRAQAFNHIAEMEQMAQTNPANVGNLVSLGVTYLMSLEQTNRALEMFDKAMARPEIKPAEVGAIAQYCAQMNNYPKLEAALRKIVEISPEQPAAYYDLAALLSLVGKNDESFTTLKTALTMNDHQRATNPSLTSLRAALQTDARFERVRNLPEFKKVIAP